MNFIRTSLAFVLFLFSCGGAAFAERAEVTDQLVLSPKNPTAAPILAGDGRMYGATTVGGAFGFGAVYRVQASGPIEILASFTGSSGVLPGSNAAAGLTLASDGNLYGVTVAGGVEGVGTVFKVVPGGAVTSLGVFTGLQGSLPGFRPVGSLAVGQDGNLYGTTREGGAAQAGSFFRVTVATGIVTHLASFTGGSGVLPGYYPGTTLALAGDGQLYGASDTASGLGQIFKLSTSGVVMIVAGFTEATGTLPGSGRFVSERFAPDGLGNLYGTSGLGGPGGFGTIFRILANGTVRHVAAFTGTTGALPGNAPQLNDFPTRGSDGFMYGTTEAGGAGDFGTIYRVSPAGVATSVASFTGTSGALQGSHPRAPLTQAGDGNLYGTTRDGSVAGRVFRVVPGGSVTAIGETVGPGGQINGTPLETPLTLGPGGDVYGIAQYGGTANLGMIFRVSPSTGVNAIGSFYDVNGSAPKAALTSASDGFLYGTTPTGGSGAKGLVFRIPLDTGRVNPLGSFTGQDGALPGNQPVNRLVPDAAGTLYGTALAGGASNGGTVFKVVPGSPPQLVAPFNNSTLRGSVPWGELFRASDGFLYGSASGNFAGLGAIWRISPAGQAADLAGTLTRPSETALREGGDGRLYGVSTAGGIGFGSVIAVNRSTGAITVLANFTGTTGALPGTAPRSNLTLANDGNFYGSTTGGTIFKVTIAGTVTSIATFTGTTGALPGGEPSAALVPGGDGSLYGVTKNGGAANAGIVFRVVPGASPRVENVVAFTGTGGALPGSTPVAELLLAPNGVLYGTTSLGGAGNNGTLFRVETNGAARTIASLTGGSGALPGAMPLAPLAIAADGSLYGTTSASGAGGGGTVFRIVNNPPVTRASTFGAVSGGTVTLSAAKLLMYASDPDGDTMQIIAVSPASAQGGTVTLSGGLIRYTAPAGYSGPDSFTYTLRDSSGSQTLGTVNVTVTAASAPSLNVVSIAQTADGFLVRFAGIPGASYRIQYRDALTDAWQLLDPPGAIQAGANGLFEYEDRPTPKPASRFYRAIVP